MTSERITNIIGYSAETSGANENPRWGHFTAAWTDSAQERLDRWLQEHDAELIDFSNAKNDVIAGLEAERDGLAAVVDQVRSYVESLSDLPEHPLEAYHRATILDMLPYPSVALDRVKAEARAEGVREARAYILRIAPAGLVDRASVLADLEIAAERLSQGIHANGRDRIEKGGSND